MTREMDGNGQREPKQPGVTSGRTAASAWAIAILQKQIEKTGMLGIPGFGITLRRRDDPLEDEEDKNELSANQPKLTP